MNAKELPEYATVVSALTPILYDLPPKLIAIDGRSGTGKTTLGRYLAWRFNVSLVEADLFLIPNQGRLTYQMDALRHVIRSRSRTTVIVESIANLQLLAELKFQADFLVYVSSKAAPESRGLTKIMAAYEKEWAPKERADVRVDLDDIF